MNKTELVEAVASHADMPKTSAAKAVDAIIKNITDALKRQDDVTLVGFGTFSVKDRAERMGRNPQTGQPMKIKAAKQPFFKAGKSLKDAVQ